MEDVLDWYAEPYDRRRPQVCFDARPVPLISETRPPRPARPGQPLRYADAYRRAGTAQLLLFVQPLRGWRHVTVTERRTKTDCAMQMQELIDVHLPEAEVMRLVVDHLTTHTPAALDETCAAAAARRLTRQLAWHSTPKQGSWLNRAECACAVLTEQCLDRRIPHMATLCHASTAWQAARNHNKTRIHWRFRTTDARLTLTRLSPSASGEARLPESGCRQAAGF